MNTLVWTYNTEITSELFPEYTERDRTTMYINYYRLSIDRASKLGYRCILYTTNLHLKYFNDLDVEIIIVENINSKLFDFIKIKVLETRNDDYILIDGDLILNKKLNIPTNVSISYDFLEIKSWDMIYSKYVNTLTNLNLNNYIKEWTGIRRSHITNCGLLYFTDSKFKQLYIDKWYLLDNFIKNHIEITKQINYSATAAQYLLTELIDYYNIDSVSFKDISDNESYTHYYGDSKFKNPIVPTNKIIELNSNQII